MESLPLLLMIVLAFLLLVVLPSRQRKKMQAKAQALQDSLTVGTPVMLASGIYGTIAGLGEGTVDLEVSPGVVLTVARPAVVEVRTPASGSPEATSGATGTVDGDADGDPTDPTR